MTASIDDDSNTPDEPNAAAAAPPEESQPAPDQPGRWAALPRRLRMAIVAVGAAAIVLALVKIVVEVRDRSDPVDTAAIVKQFDEAEGGSDGNAETELASGAFVYNAKGPEYVDLLGGPLHEFPPEVVTTTTGNDCGGSTVRLKLFEQRDDELVLCATEEGDLSLQSFTTRHEFVGVKDETITTCPEATVWPAGLFQLDTRPKATVKCTASGDMVGTVPAVLTSEVLGHESVTVDGTKVDTQRLRISTVVGTKGTTTYGTYDNDFWVTEEGVVVRRTLDANVSAKTPAGQVGFKESYDLFLQELPA